MDKIDEFKIGFYLQVWGEKGASIVISQVPEQENNLQMAGQRK